MKYSIKKVVLLLKKTLIMYEFSPKNNPFKKNSEPKKKTCYFWLPVQNDDTSVNCKQTKTSKDF